jgi:large subunit ribosomal protein L22
MEITAKTRHIRISPRKLRLVSDLIRGEMVSNAMSTLKFTTKRGAKIMYKTLMSAVANAEVRGTINMDNLYVKSGSTKVRP